MIDPQGEHVLGAIRAEIRAAMSSNAPPILMRWECGANPCADCRRLRDGSPYAKLPTWPGMGDTKCGAECACSVVADEQSWSEALQQ